MNWSQKILYKWNRGAWPKDSSEPKPYKIPCGEEGGKKHDWQIYKRVLALNILNSMDNITKAEPEMGRFVSLSKYFVDFISSGEKFATKIRVPYSSIQKVCLRCGVCVNEVEKTKETIQKQLDTEVKEKEKVEERKALADKLWNACEGGVNNE